MSKRIDGTAATETPVAAPAGRVQLDEYGILGDLEPGTRALVIGNPESAAYAVTGTTAALRLFALQVLATTLAMPADDGLLPGPDERIEINEPTSPAGSVIETLMDEVEVSGSFSGYGTIADYGDVAAVEVDDGPSGKFLVACVSVPRPR